MNETIIKALKFGEESVRRRNEEKKFWAEREINWHNKRGKKLLKNIFGKGIEVTIENSLTSHDIFWAHHWGNLLYFESTFKFRFGIPSIIIDDRFEMKSGCLFIASVKCPRCVKVYEIDSLGKYAFKNLSDFGERLSELPECGCGHKITQNIEEEEEKEKCLKIVDTDGRT